MASSNPFRLVNMQKCFTMVPFGPTLSKKVTVSPFAFVSVFKLAACPSQPQSTLSSGNKSLIRKFTRFVMGLTWKRNGLGYLGMETSHSLNSVLNVGEYASDKMEAISWLPPKAMTVVEVVLDWFLEYSPPEVLDFAPT